VAAEVPPIDAPWPSLEGETEALSNADPRRYSRAAAFGVRAAR
jgi:hypothetical protein